LSPGVEGKHHIALIDRSERKEERKKRACEDGKGNGTEKRGFSILHAAILLTINNKQK